MINKPLPYIKEGVFFILKLNNMYIEIGKIYHIIKSMDIIVNLVYYMFINIKRLHRLKIHNFAIVHRKRR